MSMLVCTLVIFTITASVVIMTAVAVAVVRAANRLNPPEPEHSADFWREAARECEKEWSVSHRSID